MNSSNQPTIHVCMHVLSRARLDVRALREANTLVEAGYQVSILDIESDPALPTEEEIQGISVKHIIMPSLFTAARFKPGVLLKTAELFMKRINLLMEISADVYQAQDEDALLACYLAARLRGKPLVYDAYELPFTKRPLTEMSWQRRWFYRLTAPLVRYVIEHCAEIMTVSSPIAREIGRLYHRSDVALLRNIPAYQAVARNDRLRQHLGLGPETRIALYQGGLQYDRWLDGLIRAARFLEPNMLIVMMGPGAEETLAQLHRLIADEGVTDRVKILPAVPYKELLAWTASADLGLIIYPPNYSLNVQWCLPNKLFEYLMVGLPILSSQLEAVAEITCAYDIGRVVSSLIPADVGAAISAMLADRPALERMHRNALNAAKQEFNWEKEKETLVQLYQKVLAEHNIVSQEKIANEHYLSTNRFREEEYA